MGITERSAYGIVTGLAAAGYVVKRKDGRRNRYQIQAHLRLPGFASQEPAMGDVLALPAGTSTKSAADPDRTRPEATAAERAYMHPGRRQAPGSPARLIRPEVRDGPQPQAGKLLARKRLRLVPVTGGSSSPGSDRRAAWRALRSACNESLRQAIEALRSAAGQNRQRAPAA